MTKKMNAEGSGTADADPPIMTWVVVPNEAKRGVAKKIRGIVDGIQLLRK